MSKYNCPSEDEDQMTFVQQLEAHRIPFWHTNNEMWTKSIKQKTRSKAMGTQSGIPDLFLVFADGLIGIEMKRAKGGVVSPTQRKWHRILEKSGIPVYICRGYDSAMETLDYLEANHPKLDLEFLDDVEAELNMAELDKIAKKFKKTTKNPKKQKNELPY